MKDEIFNQIICKRITNLRKKNNLTMEKLAYQSGISKGGLSEIERKFKEPRALTINNVICKRISTLRKEHNLTLEQLAYQSGISKGGLSEIERNMKEPRAYTILRICSGLGITMKDFFDYNEIDDFINSIS